MSRIDRIDEVSHSIEPSLASVPAAHHPVDPRNPVIPSKNAIDIAISENLHKEARKRIAAPSCRR
jgi:hypothetical protein